MAETQVAFTDAQYRDDPRPTWDEYFMDITRALAARADCTRRTASALIVKKNRIISSGYNGAPAGQPGCLSSGACPRGQLSQDELAAYSSYDSGPGFCIAVHAEANALLYADRANTEGATLYTWSNTPNCEPCAGCRRLIMGAGISRLVYPSKDFNGAFSVEYFGLPEYTGMHESNVG